MFCFNNNILFVRLLGVLLLCLYFWSKIILVCTENKLEKVIEDGRSSIPKGFAEGRKSQEIHEFLLSWFFSMHIMIFLFEKNIKLVKRKLFLIILCYFFLLFLIIGIFLQLFWSFETDSGVLIIVGYKYFLPSRSNELRVLSFYSLADFDSR